MGRRCRVTTISVPADSTSRSSSVARFLNCRTPTLMIVAIVTTI
jgi:hypothetical protein